MRNHKRDIGIWGETIAQRYLQQCGYAPIDRHWQRREGEIDLICFDQTEMILVFVEVRARTTETFGQPEESIGELKKRRLEAIIFRYLEESGYRGEYRLDVVTAKKMGKTAVLRHLKNVSLD